MGTQPFRSVRLKLSIPERTIGLLLFVVAALFMLTGTVTLYLTPYPVSLSAGHLIAVLCGWALAWGGSYWVLRSRLSSFGLTLLPLAAMLTGLGLLLQARLAPAMILKQVLWVLLGCGVMCAAALTPNLTRLLRRYRYTLLSAGLVLLCATLIFGTNPSGYGQELWLGLFGIYLQPSEFLKLLLIIYLAAYLSEKRDLPKVKAGGQPMWLVVLGPMAAMVGLALLLLGWQQDLGAALLFYLTFVVMIYLAWGNGWYVLLSLVLFIPVGLAGSLLSDRVGLRVSIWLDPWAPEQADRAFQILQSIFAFGAGGLFGQGLGQGSPGLIPAVHTDFVYPALVEEFGLLGGLGFLLLLATFVYRGIRLAQQSQSVFESLLAGGIAAQIGLQAWVIVGGNTKLIPITGVTLPFLSYGGSSLLTTLAATGLLLNLSTRHAIAFNLPLTPHVARPLRHTAARLGQGLLVLLTTTALISGFWSVPRAGELQVYPTNPRYRMSESRIRRGRILDRNSTVLADIEVDAEGYVTRTYPVPEAAPVVGYATFAYGTDGIESTCNARLRGDINRTAWDVMRADLLHLDPTGRDVRLTVDARLQTEAQTRLRDQVGAVVLLDTRNGDILALASSPIYDASTVAEAWATLRDQTDSPFLNRAMQGLAQPGTSLQPLILGSTLQEDATLAAPEPINTAVPFDGMRVTCRVRPADVLDVPAWQAALNAGCPYPFTAAAARMGDTQFTERLTAWGLRDAPALVLPTVASDLGDAPLDVRTEALGQGQLLVTPLQMALAMATLGNEGVRPTPRLLAQPETGCTVPPVEEPERVLDAEVAEQVRKSLASFDGAVGHIGISFAGPERQQAWFLGLSSASLPRYAVAVFLDHVETPQKGGQQAAELGVTLLQRVLERQASF